MTPGPFAKLALSAALLSALSLAPISAAAQSAPEFQTK